MAVTRLTDAELITWANALHRGFNPTPERLIDVVMELLERRGLREHCHLCGECVQAPCQGRKLSSAP